MRRAKRLATRLWRRLTERRRVRRMVVDRARFWSEVRAGEREAALRARR
jgi:hypothetical protein